MKSLRGISTVYLSLAVWLVSASTVAQTAEPPQQPAAPGAMRSQPVVPTRVVEIVKLQHADSSSVAKLLREIGLPSATVAVDPGSNCLLISAATDETLAQTIGLLARLDQPAGTFEKKQSAPIAVSTVQLRASDPQNLTRLLAALQPAGADLRILADPMSRSVWLGGEKSAVDQFTALAERIESQARDSRADERETRFYRVKNADTRGLANTLNEFVRTMPMEVRIVPDPVSNTLLAYATSTQHEQLTRIITELDVVPAERPAEKQPEPAKPAAQGDGTGTHG